MDYLNFYLMRLTGFRIRNFKMFRDVSVRNLSPLAIFIGANASGKSTLFDVFRFLRELFAGESLNDTFARRGGFAEVLSRNAEKKEIEISLDFSMLHKDGEADTEYMIRFGWANHLPFVLAEHFSFRINRGKKIDLFHANYDANSAGAAPSVREIDPEAKVSGMYEAAKIGGPFSSLLSDPDFAIRYIHRFSDWFNLAAKQEGKNLPPFPFRFSLVKDEHSPYITFFLSMCVFIRQLFIGEFELIPIRESAKATGIDRLSEKGENLALFAKKIRENNPDKFESAVSALRRFVPEIKTVEPAISEDGYAFLRFVDRNFDRPFNSRAMSDGTVLAFAYLLLLANAKEKLICIDEVERSLYPHMLDAMIAEVRRHTIENKGQAMLTTHSSDLLDCAELEEVFWLAKRGGETVIHRAQDNKIVRALVKSGDPLGVVWHKGDFEGADPSA